MWGSCEKMARAVGEGIGAAGARPTLMALSGSHRSDVATRLLDSGALLVGAPTLNNELFPRMADVLTYIKGLRPQGLLGAAFGSFGWSGESIAQLNDFLAGAGVELLADPVKSKFVPDEDLYRQCFELGKTVGETLVKRHKS
jgi:flavorubredoxin